MIGTYQDHYDMLNFSCHSSIGRDGGEQTITIGPDCYYLGVIMHEMTHAVGFFHEQNRMDRDQYITVHWNNIQPGEQFLSSFSPYIVSLINHIAGNCKIYI